VIVYVAAPAPPPQWSRAFVASLALHGAFFGALVAIMLRHPVVPPEPPPIRVQLLRIAETPAPAPQVAAVVAPPAPKVAPAPPKPKTVAPQPVVARVTAKPAPAPKPIAPAPVVEAAASAPSQTAAVSAPGPAIESGAASASAGLYTGRSVTGSTDPIDLYIAQMRAMILKHKRYPPLAKRRGIEGYLVLRLVVAADGSVEVGVVESSGTGVALLEEGARAAVAAVSPLPPPPSGRLRFEVPVRFTLKE
jgi:protein TonB